MANYHLEMIIHTDLTEELFRVIRTQSATGLNTKAPIFSLSLQTKACANHAFITDCASVCYASEIKNTDWS